MAKREPAVPEMAERIWLAAVGKHPGWNDHLDDIGLDTDRLVAVKRQLYVDGIGGVIGAGTWEAMPEASRDEGFAHSFLWRQPDGLVVGRMWSSSDGKGRRKFPMIVCAMCRSLPLGFVAGPVLDRLRRLEQQCRSVSTAAEVISAVDAMRVELRDLASHTPLVTKEPISGEGSASRLASSEAMGPEGLGLVRVLYQMEREMAAYLKPDGTQTGSRSRTLEVRAQHMRVPAVFEKEAESWSVWLRLLLGRVDQLAPLMLISKDERGWVDVIAGEPGTAQLVCLQGSLDAFPYTSEIPFSIDELTANRAREWIAKSRAGELSELDPGYIDASSDRLAPFLKKARKRQEESRAGGRKQLTMALAAAAVVLVICVILAVLFFGGNRGGGAESGQTAGQKEPEPEPARAERRDPAPAVGGGEPTTSPAAPAGSRERTERFREWCVLAEDWFQPFVSGIDREVVRGDPHLEQALLGSLDRAGSAGVDLDPMRATTGRYRSISALAENPPEEIFEPVFASKIESALGVMQAVRGSIAADAWPAHASLNRVIERLNTSGEPVSPGLVTIRESLASTDGATAAAGVGALLAVNEAIDRLAGALALREASADRLRSAGAETQAGWYRSIRVTGGLSTVGDDPGAWLDGAVRNAERVAADGVRLAEIAERDLPRVDRGLLGEATAGLTGESAEADLNAWAEALSDRSLYLLDPAEDPRRVLGGAGGLGDLEERLAGLRGGPDDAESADLAARADRWRADLAGLESLAWNEATREEIVSAVGVLRSERAQLMARLDTMERERRYEAEAYLAALREKGTISGTGSDAIDSVWRAARDELIAGFERDGDLVALSRAVDALEGSLVEIESAMPPIEFDAGIFGSASGAVRSAVSAARESRLGEAAARYGDRSSIEQSASAYAGWAEGVVESAGIAGGLTSGIDSWVTLDEETGAGTTRELLAMWDATWIGERIAPGEIDARLGVLAEQIAPGDRAVLARVIEDPSSSPAGVYAAWSSLGGVTPAWPADRSELVAEAGAVSRLRRELDSLPAERRREIARVLDSGSASRWSRLAGSAAGWDEFRPIAETARTMGIEPGSLSVELAFHLMVAGLMDRVERGEQIDREALLESAEELLDRGLGAHAAAEAWLSTLRDRLAGREEDDVDYRAIGPARAGWVVEPFEAGRLLVYTWLRDNEPAVRMGFRLVESAATGAFYLSETEAPASLLFSFALEGAHSDAVIGTMDRDWTPLEDPRPGPSVWTWRRGRDGARSIQLNRSWTARSQGDEREYYAPSIAGQVGRPSEQHPLQRISPEAAALLAALAGCRLPTAAEWAAAYEHAGRPGPDDGWNLRDQSFETQRVYVASQSGARSPRWPDEGIFIPPGRSVGEGIAAESLGWSDGRLWFDEINSGRDRPFRHIIGNVAEYVLLAQPEGLMTDRGTPPGESLARISTASGGQGVFGVVGGSALSPPGMPLSEPVRVDFDGNRSGYSDVGFRLAFSPGVETPLVVEVGEALRSAPYLRTR